MSQCESAGLLDAAADLLELAVAPGRSWAVDDERTLATAAEELMRAAAFQRHERVATRLVELAGNSVVQFTPATIRLYFDLCASRGMHSLAAAVCRDMRTRTGALLYGAYVLVCVRTRGEAVAR